MYIYLPHNSLISLRISFKFGSVLALCILHKPNYFQLNNNNLLRATFILWVDFSHNLDPIGFKFSGAYDILLRI